MFQYNEYFGLNCFCSIFSPWLLPLFYWAPFYLDCQVSSNIVRWLQRCNHNCSFAHIPFTQISPSCIMSFLGNSTRFFLHNSRLTFTCFHPRHPQLSSMKEFQLSSYISYFIRQVLLKMICFEVIHSFCFHLISLLQPEHRFKKPHPGTAGTLFQRDLRIATTFSFLREVFYCARPNLLESKQLNLWVQVFWNCINIIFVTQRV